MADPYATKPPDLSARPTGPPAWEAAVGERGGAVVGAGGDVPGAAFLVVSCNGIGALAPFARLEPPLAVLLWLEHSAQPQSGEATNRLFAELREFDGPVFAIKQGQVGGPRERPGCFAIEQSLVLAVLDRALAGEVDWEPDPDFGYDVPAAVPGVLGEAARALLPRLLYADNDRVYEHAGLVAAKQRERAAIAESVAGLVGAVRAAAGWPPVPSGDTWRD